MSFDGDFRKRKRPPPQQGIKVREMGTTWWGQRWIEALEHFSRDYLSRLGRGRSYARTGRVHDLKISPGLVTAVVTGTEEYDVSLRMDVFTNAEWNMAIKIMAQEARYAALLLAGQMPPDIESVFRRCKRSLFPSKSHDLETDCSCPDWASPCKHVAAMHYVLGEAFDRDPFLLFELRGRTRDQVLAALSRLRSGVDEVVKQPRRQELAPTSVEVSPEAWAQYEVPPVPLPTLRFHFDPPQTAAAILRSLPPPRPWSLEESPADFLADLYAAASERARHMALGVPETNPEADAPATHTKVRRKVSKTRS
mgnify:CR=1 FL=1|jgi:uncharacterized Zn finger protein